MSSAPPVGPYTPVVKAGDLLFVSGQIGLLDGEMVEGFATQVHQSMTNLQGQVESQGLTLESVVKTTIFITDMAKYAEMNDIYLEHFGEHRPARSCVAVSALPRSADFEIEAVLYVG